MCLPLLYLGWVNPADQRIFGTFLTAMVDAANLMAARRLPNLSYPKLGSLPTHQLMFSQHC
jgi:hypothetical protein